MSARLCLATTDKRRTSMRAQMGVRSTLRGGFAAPRPLAFAAGRATGLRVVLVGWLGAQPKYLAKYTELWEKQGATVVPYIPPMTAALFPAQADRSVRMSEARPAVVHLQPCACVCSRSVCSVTTTVVGPHCTFVTRGPLRTQGGGAGGSLRPGDGAAQHQQQRGRAGAFATLSALLGSLLSSNPQNSPLSVVCVNQIH